MAKTTTAGPIRLSLIAITTHAPEDVAMILSLMLRTGEEFSSVRHTSTGNSKGDLS